MAFNSICIPDFTYNYYAPLLILTSLSTINSEMEITLPSKKQCNQNEYYNEYNKSCGRCSVCNNSSDRDFQVDECIQKNPGAVANGLFLYCNKPNGPFTVTPAFSPDNTTQTASMDSTSTFSIATESAILNHTKQYDHTVLIGILSAVAVVVTLGIMAAVVIKWRKRRFTMSLDFPAGEAWENRTEANGVLLTTAQEDEQRSHEKQNHCCDKQSCCSAFKALINDRAVLIELSTLFDREYAPDMVTWHSLAMGLLQLDPARVVHKEYVARPALGEGPSHGPTYGVLHEMYCSGLRLQDLLLWLQRPEQQVRFNAGRALEILHQFSDNLSASALLRDARHRAV